ncbi:unnamed protein product, partial [Brassica oleracea var. botrytis]
MEVKKVLMDTFFGPPETVSTALYPRHTLSYGKGCTEMV